MVKRVLVFVAVATAIAPSAAMAKPGDLDSGFGTNGLQIYRGLGFGDRPFSHGVGVTGLSDGRIVVAGYDGDGGGSNHAIAIRTSATGALDTSFAGTGVYENAVSPNGLGASAIGAYPVAGGKLIVAGRTTYHGTSFQFFVQRVNANGTLDTSFGTNGTTVTNINEDYRPSDVAVDPQGRTLIAGSARDVDHSNGRIVIARYTADGKVDTSFGSGGTFVTGADGSSAGKIAATADGKVLWTGLDTASGKSVFDVGRLDSTGKPDPSFAGGGVMTLDNDNVTGTLGIAPIGSGRTLLCISYGPDVTFIRLTAAGQPDSAYGNGGRSTFSVGGNDQSVALAPAPGGGTVLLGGTDGVGIWVARTDANGVRDTSYGSGGAAFLTKSNTLAWLGVTALADGAVLVTGNTQLESNQNEAATLEKLEGNSGPTPPPGSGSQPPPTTGTGGGSGGDGGGTSQTPARPISYGRPAWRRHEVVFRLHCTAASTCTGKALLIAAHGKHHVSRTKAFEVGPGAKTTVRLRPTTKATRARLEIVLTKPSRAMHTRAVELR